MDGSRQTPAEKMLEKGIPIFYISEEHGGMVEESPDGSIRLVDRVEDGQVIYQDDTCLNYG